MQCESIELSKTDAGRRERKFWGRFAVDSVALRSACLPLLPYVATFHSEASHRCLISNSLSHSFQYHRSPRAMSSSKETSDDEIYVKLVSAQGDEFFILRSIAVSHSHTMKSMLEGQFREATENLIRFPEISSVILEKVVRYLYYKEQHKQSTTRIPEFTIEPEMALELMIAAKYLDC